MTLCNDVLWVCIVRTLYTALVVIEGVVVGGIYPEHYYKINALFVNCIDLAKAI